MEVETQNTEDTDELHDIVSVQSETQILQIAADKIKKLANRNLTDKNIDIKLKNTHDLKELETGNEYSILRARLQDQVRTGEITPFEAAKKESITKNIFGKSSKESSQLLNLEKYLLQQAELTKLKKLSKGNKTKINKSKDEVPSKKLKKTESKLFDNKHIHTKLSKQRNVKKIETITSKSLLSFTSTENLNLSETNNIQANENNTDTNNMNCLESTSGIINTHNDFDISNGCDMEQNIDSGSEYVPSDDYDSEDDSIGKSEKKKKIDNTKQIKTRLKRVLDDGDEDIYRQRVEDSSYKKNEVLHKVDHLFKVPKYIWKQLYKYQKVSVRWLWELHTRNLGGLLGDEMGLGKTVQVIAFLAGLDCSELLSDGGRFRGLGPTLIVCPATLLEQWVKHFHDWRPTFRVAILHQSGTFQGGVEDLLNSLKPGGILVTSYSGVLIHKESLIKFKWHYVILDEGHKIRNPEAKVSKVVKAFLTPHRLLLTGSPMQNSLKELWSLFDFILPGKLGTLSAFMEHCAGPITRGGYSNATHLQEATALQVATMLKNAITPYMLRRTKFDVQHHLNLPNKNEQVLFCSLTEEQRELYNQYLRSDEVSYVLHEKREGGRYKAKLLVALTALRKLCNHPDLFLYNYNQESDEETELEVDENQIDKFGHWKRAGKMTVVRSLLKIWKKQEHRVLLFTQSRQMMHILEGLVQKEKYSYLRMDGTTPMNQRQLTISKFNKDSSFFIFLLTTRVGGLGVNLTGADRVIIYDPDWNPATDAQARERTWRIGQDKSVTVYRLITAGTIEEKIYHRQVFKILLSNRVLEDPRQRRLFRTSDLTELFNLNEPINGDKSESDQLFKDSKLSPNSLNFSSSKIEAMKKLASTLSKKISEASIQKCNENNSNSLNAEALSNSNSNKNTNDDLIDTNIDNNLTMTGDITQEKNLEQTKIIDTSKEMDEIQLGSQLLVHEKSGEDEKLITKDINKATLSNTDTSFTEIENVKKNENSYNSSKKKINNSKNYKVYQKHKKYKKATPTETVSAIFEGEKISCLIGRRLGKSQTADPISNADDHYVLSKLFSKSAVSSAFQHESVLSNAVLNPDHETPLQRAAKATASEKMDCIRQSRKWCWKPCWDNPPEEDYDDDDFIE